MVIVVTAAAHLLEKMYESQKLFSVFIFQYLPDENSANTTC